MQGPALDHEVRTLAGAPRSLADYRGQVLLIVNTASQCGLTPQYHALEALHQRFRGRGFSVLGFPCNDFGAQEPGSPEEIQQFCATRFQINFPLFEKVKAKGDKSPLYRTLTEELPEGLRGEIKWNFTKFLVGKDGRVSHRFEPQIEPLAPEVMQAVERALSA
ncbi:glutathione peroxidase [Nannocystis exedens]|uniref:Glutathione peroxidase n=1 Tax=Nannocystis exedens TaxID=54 RepID=A0A1I1YQS6_9BACT|nr:glutathione peroxidase [Nannocystis exedens]PCC70224.1 glutathione peroxidase [Nannocystis exedens]SFE21662.1 glutathione peroxidase [Nannocystis exedens]